MLKILNLADLF
jgi:hypothetical protein